MKLTGIRELIFSDRYALKCPYKELKTGDKVVALISTEGQWETRAVGYVEEILAGGEKAKVRLSDETTKILNTSNLDKLLEHSPEQMWDRMAEHLTKEKEYIPKYKNILKDFNFVPGGRINASLGASETLSKIYDQNFENRNTLLNCFVISPKNINGKGIDSREAIMDTLKRMTNLMSAGGGVGIPLDSLRPRKSIIQGVNGISSGAISWGSLSSSATGLISQGGSRRGALLEGLNIAHPDIVEFIFSKCKPEDLAGIKEKWQSKFPNASFISHDMKNANLSVLITDDFMSAVKEDKEWQLYFPDYENMDKEEYNNLWDGDLQGWKAKGLPIKIYDTFKAKDLWDCIMESAWRSAEPGIIFIDRMNKEHNGWYYGKIKVTNPCESYCMAS